MRAATRAFLASALILAPAAAFAGKTDGNADVPQWVRDAAAAEKGGTYSAETDAVVLLDETDINVAQNGDRTVTYRRAMRILRPQGRKDATPTVYFDGETKVLNAHAWSIAPDGKTYEVKQKEFVESDPYDAILYDDTHLLVADVPGRDVGSVVAWEFQQRERPFLVGDIWPFQEEDPVKLARFSLTLPPSWEFKTAWVHADERKPQQPNPNTWTWEVKDVAGIERQPLMPPRGFLLGRMLLTYLAPQGFSGVVHSWQEMGNWYYGLTSPRVEVTPEIQAKALELTKDAPTPFAKVKAIAAYMQKNIRYFGVVLGVGGFQPHPASLVYKYGYGDCKDKATLMRSLLKAVGIESYYVVVNTKRGMVSPDAAVHQFDHAILAVRLPAASNPEVRSTVQLKSGEQVIIFDSTDELTPVGDLAPHLQGSYALVVTSTGGEMVQFPVLPPETNELRRIGKLRLDSRGVLYGAIEEHRTGAAATSLRYELLHADAKERRKVLESFLGDYLPAFILQKGTIVNLDVVDQELVLKYEFAAVGYAKAAGPLLLVRPRVVGDKARYLDDKPRKYPYAFSSSLAEDEFEFELPPGYVADELPDPVQVDVGFAKYTSKTEFSDGKLRYKREYRVNDLMVPVDKEKDVRRLFSSIVADERASAVLKQAN